MVLLGGIMSRNNINDYDDSIEAFSDDFLNLDLNINGLSEEIDPYAVEYDNNTSEDDEDSRDSSQYRIGNLNRERNRRISADNSIRIENQGYLVRGIVRNFNEQEIPTFFITKVYRTIFMGLPYVNSNIVNTFQIYDQWTSDRGEEVVVYGKIVNGQIPENNIVQVWGKRKSNGTIVAKKIKNETTNTFLRINHSISGVGILILILGLIGLLFLITQINWVGLIVGILSGIINIILGTLSGILPSFMEVATKLIEIVLPLIIAIVGFSMLFNKKR